MYLISEIPNIRKLEREAFSAAAVYSGYPSPVLYPVTDEIAFIFPSEKVRPEILSFPKFVKYLYEGGSGDFVAMARFPEAFVVFARKGKEFKYYEFDEKEAVMGVVSVLARYAGENTDVAVLEDEEGVAKKIVEEALKILDAQKEREGGEAFPKERVTFAKVKVSEKDMENLLRKKSFREMIDERFRKLFLALGKKKEASEIRSKRMRGVVVGAIAVITALLAYEGYLYYESQKKPVSKGDSRKRISAEMMRANEKKNGAAADFMTALISSGKFDYAVFSPEEGFYLTGPEGVCSPYKKVKERTTLENGEYCVLPISSIPKGEPSEFGKKRPRDYPEEIVRKLGLRPVILSVYPGGSFVSVSIPKDGNETHVAKALFSRLKRGDIKYEASLWNGNDSVKISVRTEKFKPENGKNSSKKKKSGQKIVLGG